MKPGLPVIAVCLILSPPAGLAQTVYESKSSRGKVYSDRPMPGSRAVELQPLNVVEPVPVVPPAANRLQDKEPLQDKPVAIPYRSLAIAFPEADGSVAANHATFEVRVAVDPPLQVERGHAFSLRMDGRPVPGRYTSTEMMIPPEFFGNVAPAGVQRHVLEASIVDAGGQVLLVSSQVSFQTRFVTILQQPRLQARPTVPPRHPAEPPVPRSEPDFRPDGRRGLDR